jgi:formylglycine-generating enzyme required for sulfatase activity
VGGAAAIWVVDGDAVPLDIVLRSPLARNPTRLMALNPAQQVALRKALMDAFSLDDLLEMAWVRLNLDRNEIDTSGARKRAFSRVVEWAEQRGRTTDLVQAALDARPDNPAIRRFVGRNYPALLPAPAAERAPSAGPTPDRRRESRPPRTRAWVAAGAAVVAAVLLVVWSGVWRPEPPKVGKSEPPKVSKSEPFANSVGMELVPIPEGEFLMGAHAQEKDGQNFERPQHRVRIPRPFYLGAREVTQQQYPAVMRANPSAHSPAWAEKTKVKGLNTDHFPVENVSWEDARKFCEQLSALPAERQLHRVYRLPLEAEWEYACRAGGPPESRFHFPEADFFESANLVDNTGPGGAVRRRGYPVAVASFRPNKWGLFNMHGNVREWCADWYDPCHMTGFRTITAPFISYVRTSRRRMVLLGRWSCRVSRSANGTSTRSLTCWMRMSVGLTPLSSRRRTKGGEVRDTGGIIFLEDTAAAEPTPRQREFSPAEHRASRGRRTAVSSAA